MFHNVCYWLVQKPRNLNTTSSIKYLLPGWTQVKILDQIWDLLGPSGALPNKINVTCIYSNIVNCAYNDSWKHNLTIIVSNILIINFKLSFTNNELRQEVLCRAMLPLHGWNPHAPHPSAGGTATTHNNITLLPVPVCTLCEFFNMYIHFRQAPNWTGSS